MRRARLAAGAALCGAGVLVLAVLVGTADRTPGIDRSVAEWIHANRIDGLDRTWRAIALGGGSAGLGVVVLAGCILAWRRGGRRWLAFLVGCFVGTEVLFWTMKAVVDRPRPPLSLQFATAGSASYPSGHTAIATAVAASLAVAASRAGRRLPRRSAVAALVALPVVVGFSRIALGVHWLTDVGGGALLGLGWVLALAALGLHRRTRPGVGEPDGPGRPEGYGGATGPQSGAGRKGAVMGQPVVHFEIVGTDGEALKAYYADLFGWEIDSSNPMGYGIVPREGNTTEEGWGIGGGVAGGPPGYAGHVTVYVAVDDVEAALTRAEELGGTRIMGPEAVMEGLVIGQFADPEGHVIGVLRGEGSM